jgi:hypothetical protein
MTLNVLTLLTRLLLDDVPEVINREATSVFQFLPMYYISK